MKSLKILFFMAVTALAVQAFANSDNADKIRERIAPVGTVCTGAECGGGAVASTKARSAEDIFNSNCNACHGSGILGAPKKGDTAAWDARFAQGEKTVLNHAIHGLNAMPPKGNCGDCSDDDLLKTIKFMAGR